MLAVIRGRGLLPSLVPPCGVCQCCPRRDFFFLLLKADRLCVEVSFAACPLCH